VFKRKALRAGAKVGLLAGGIRGYEVEMVPGDAADLAGGGGHEVDADGVHDAGWCIWRK
jgi:hypothetical protein